MLEEGSAAWQSITKPVLLVSYVSVRVGVRACAHVRTYVWEQIHQCKHIDLSAGCLLHCASLPMVPRSKLITHDEMINLLRVSVSVHRPRPYVVLSVSPANAFRWEHSLLTNALLRLLRDTKKGEKKSERKSFPIVPFSRLSPTVQSSTQLQHMTVGQHPDSWASSDLCVWSVALFCCRKQANI